MIVKLGAFKLQVPIIYIQVTTTNVSGGAICGKWFFLGASSTLQLVLCTYQHTSLTVH